MDREARSKETGKVRNYLGELVSSCCEETVMALFGDGGRRELEKKAKAEGRLLFSACRSQRVPRSFLRGAPESLRKDRGRGGDEKRAV